MCYDFSFLPRLLPSRSGFWTRENFLKRKLLLDDDGGGGGGTAVAAALLESPLFYLALTYV